MIKDLLATYQEIDSKLLTDKMVRITAFKNSDGVHGKITETVFYILYFTYSFPLIVYRYSKTPF